MNKKQRKTIVVGMSGGVDSSVAAALLVAAGHNVIGAFMKNWSDTKDPLTGACAWRTERRDAEAVAAHLGIPFHTFDFEREYREAVVEYLFREYAAGRTPNPDVLCNKYVKFNFFLKEALKLGADLIATGHYARVRQRAGRVELLAGSDPNKDQSYFLHQLSQEQLERVVFPVGGILKPEVRRLAREFGLPTADKKDSQGICFVGKVDLKTFLGRRLPERPGVIITMEGEVVGRHKGMAPFTIGQRHGLDLGGGDPYFVVEKDPLRNTVVVARGAAHPALFAKLLLAGDEHWISGRAPRLPLRCEARIRYRQPLQRAEVRRVESGGLLVRFAAPQRAVTPGQFVAFYRGEICLGGAVINSSLTAPAR
ncbi:MAG: tRNA 2-thiouridine(34) synthase MnmA [Patescibacteria group bacterium]|jgi:tRNA-specific 2-thiouridylase